MENPKLSEIEFHTLCYFEEGIPYGDVVRGSLNLTLEEFNKIIVKLESNKFIERGLPPAKKDDEYQFHITELGEKEVSYYVGIYDYIDL